MPNGALQLTQVSTFPIIQEKENKYVESIMKYREYILRASEHSIQSLKDILEIEEYEESKQTTDVPRR